MPAHKLWTLVLDFLIPVTPMSHYSLCFSPLNITCYSDLPQPPRSFCCRGHCRPVSPNCFIVCALKDPPWTSSVNPSAAEIKFQPPDPLLVLCDLFPPSPPAPWVSLLAALRSHRHLLFSSTFLLHDVCSTSIGPIILTQPTPVHCSDVIANMTFASHVWAFPQAKSLFSRTSSFSL